ncbi:hypothetical protein ACFX13_041435 [Malus domestica]
MIWDDHQGRCIGGLSFCFVVRFVRLQKDRIVIILEQQKTHTEVTIRSSAFFLLIAPISTRPNGFKISQSNIHSITNDNLIINIFNSLSTASCTEAMQSMLHSKSITVS